MKSKSGGSSRSALPVLSGGSFVEGSRSTSKNEWAHASSGLCKWSFHYVSIESVKTYVILAVGLYSSNLEQSAIASVDVLGRNTLLQGWAFIIGNLNSFIQRFYKCQRALNERKCDFHSNQICSSNDLDIY